jgi:hypothetical protein
MALSKEERDGLAGQARAAGKDPAAFVAAAERADASQGDGQKADAPGKAEDGARATHPNGAEVNAYHFPILRVNEIRTLYGYDGAPDGELFYDEWLAQHGGPAKPGTTE